MTDDPLDTLARLLKEATPGPVELASDDEVDDPCFRDVICDSHYAFARFVWRMEGDNRSLECEANAKLYVLLRNLAPALVEVATHGKEVGASGIELDLPELSYVTVQIERETWDAFRAALRALEVKP